MIPGALKRSAVAMTGHRKAMCRKALSNEHCRMAGNELMKPHVEYAHRRDAFSRHRIWRLEPDALSWQDDDGGAGRLPYADIIEIRTAYRPSRIQMGRYLTRIAPRAGRAFDITNSSFLGYAQFERHDEAYAAFIRELHQRLADNSTGTRFHKGSSLAGYLGNCALTMLILAALLGSTIFLLSAGLAVLVLIKIAIIAFYVPTLLRFMAKSRPAAYDPRNIPPDALPPDQSKSTPAT